MIESSDVKKEFGAVVRRERRRLGFSQERLAERAELHRTYVTDIERGARNLSIESISKLARALNTTIGALFSPLAAHLRAAGEAQGTASSPDVVDILLVEDDANDTQLTLEAFKRARLTNRVHIVRDGAAALDYLFFRGEYEHRLDLGPAMILLDLNLPKVHGLEVLRRIKADERTRSIAVVVLTMSREDEHIREALQLGADAYITKPVDFQNFSAITPQLDLHWMLFRLNHHDTAHTGSHHGRETESLPSKSTG
jgi:CheY-like chemotaxis protein/DNA-binding XRE family transcriptional regulator